MMTQTLGAGLHGYRSLSSIGQCLRGPLPVVPLTGFGHDVRLATMPDALRRPECPLPSVYSEMVGGAGSRTALSDLPGLG
jgi:hypothetical protein